MSVEFDCGVTGDFVVSRVSNSTQADKRKLRCTLQGSKQIDFIGDQVITPLQTVFATFTVDMEYDGNDTAQPHLDIEPGKVYKVTIEEI